MIGGKAASKKYMASLPVLTTGQLFLHTLPLSFGLQADLSITATLTKSTFTRFVANGKEWCV
jgi:hypothetical protein